VAYWIYIGMSDHVGVHDGTCHHYHECRASYLDEWDKKWCGPFSTQEAVLKAARKKHHDVRICKCFPQTGKRS